MHLRSTEFLGVIVFVLVVGIATGVMIATPDGRTVTLPSLPAGSERVISEAETKLVAVDRQGNGIVTDLNVRTVPGTGRILVDIDSLLFFVDTQHSIQLSKVVAENYLNISLTDRDVIYNIQVNNTSLVGGESAGGALTVATIAAIQGAKPRSDSVMTGTIMEDGTIGQVGGLISKAKAARAAGYEFFVVPKGQGTYSYTTRVQNCDAIGRTTVCKTEYKPISVSIGEEAGIQVIEVGTIDEAVQHFLSM